MSKRDNFHSAQIADRRKTLSKHTESDSRCGANLSDLECRAGTIARVCEGCGCRFVPTGPQRFCEHACYSRSLRTPIEQRFWTKVNKTASCWLWTAATLSGYGQISRNRKPAYAHRLSWEFAHGPVPDGLSVLHNCPGGDNPLCVNPAHLFLGTQQDNLSDARAKGRLDERRPRTATLTFAERLAIYHARTYRGVGNALARQYDVTKSCIAHIRKGRFAGAPVRSETPFDRTFERVPSRVLPIVGEVR